MDRRKFIALPNNEALHLTPKLWIAIGLIAYNYHLMTLEALQILTTSSHAHHVPRARLEAATLGSAVMLSTEGLSPATRSAITEIARTLLMPLGMQVSNHGGSPIPGGGRTARYLLVEDVRSSENFSLPQVGTREAIA